jgi:hypothetical protein
MVRGCRLESPWTGRAAKPFEGVLVRYVSDGRISVPACISNRGVSPILGSVPRYSLWTPTTAAVAASLVAGRPRSFQCDAHRLIAGLDPPPKVEGHLPDFGRGGWVLVMNHFARPGFRAWWIALAVSWLVPRQVHWVMTSTFTYPDRWRGAWLTPLSTIVLTRLAGCYGFTSMPPMPPRPGDVAARAQAVRRVLALAQRTPPPVIAMAPEGADAAGGILQPLWPGTGRFLLQLARRGLRFLPLGVFEAEGRLCLNIGRSFLLDFSGIHGSEGKDSAGGDDRRAAEGVARAIAACLPKALRGSFA